MKIINKKIILNTIHVFKFPFKIKWLETVSLDNVRNCNLSIIKLPIINSRWYIVTPSLLICVLYLYIFKFHHIVHLINKLVCFCYENWVPSAILEEKYVNCLCRLISRLVMMFPPIPTEEIALQWPLTHDSPYPQVVVNKFGLKWCTCTTIYM